MMGPSNQKCFESKLAYIKLILILFFHKICISVINIRLIQYHSELENKVIKIKRCKILFPDILYPDVYKSNVTSDYQNLH